MRYEYEPQGICPMQISFDIDKDNNITNVEFFGGCNGNLKAISKLIDGMNADKINELLSGNTCGRKPTSCADQLAKAVMLAKAEMINKWLYCS